MAKRKNPDSVHESCTRRSKRRGRLDKDVISPRCENFVKKDQNPYKIRSDPVYGKKNGMSSDKAHSSYYAHESCSRRSKRRGRLDKDVISPRCENFVKKDQNPYKIRSDPVYGKKNGMSNDKAHSSSNDIQTIDTKKNKAVSRSNGDSYHVSRVREEASFHRNIKKSGFRSGDKCSSSLHAIQRTDTKKNKAIGGRCDDRNCVSRDGQEASSPRNNNRRGLRSGDKCYSSLHDIRIIDTKKSKAVSGNYKNSPYNPRVSKEASHPRFIKNSFSRSSYKRLSSSHEDSSCVSKISQEASFPRLTKHRKPYRGSYRHRSSDENRATLSRLSGNVSFHKGCNESSHLRSQIFSVEMQTDAGNASLHKGCNESSHLRSQIVSVEMQTDAGNASLQKGCNESSHLRSQIFSVEKQTDAGNVSLHKGCNKSPHLRSQIFSVKKQTDAVTNSIADSEAEKTLPQTHAVPNVAKGKRLRIKKKWKKKPRSCCEFKSEIMDVKCDINGETASDSAIGQKNESLLDKSSEGKQSNFVAVEGNQVLIPADLKELSVRQSPIRGVVEELNFPNLPMKKLNKLDSSNEVCANFSSLEHFGEASKLDIQDGLRSVAIGAKNDLCNGNKHIDITTNEDKEIISLRSNVLEAITPSDVTENQDDNENLGILSAKETSFNSSRKKLLILDLNGLLADINQNHCRVHKAHKKVGGNLVLKRPFCDDFLEFCFERFHVAVWSSRKRYNVNMVVDYLMGNLKHKLLFSWDGSKCTKTGYQTLDNKHKPLVLKELKKLWHKEQNDLPWVEGEYSPLNTLLVDDSPYKAICNPPHTAIFPYSFNFTNKDDNSLGPGGDLRVYLERLAGVDDVQDYVREHPFGQKAITDDHPSWSFYRQIIDEVQKSPVLTN